MPQGTSTSTPAPYLRQKATTDGLHEGVWMKRCRIREAPGLRDVYVSPIRSVSLWGGTCCAPMQACSPNVPLWLSRTDIIMARLLLIQTSVSMIMTFYFLFESR